MDVTFAVCANLDDLSTAINLIEAARVSNGDEPLELSEYRRRFDQGNFVVGKEQNGEMVSCYTWVVNSETGEAVGNYGGVVPVEYRRQGIGTAQWNFLYILMRSRGLASVLHCPRTTDTGIASFYAVMGLTVERVYVDRFGVERSVYRKVL